MDKNQIIQTNWTSVGKEWVRVLMYSRRGLTQFGGGGKWKAVLRNDIGAES